MNKIILFLVFLEFLAFVASLFYYRRFKSKSSLYLSWFLGFTVLVELIGQYTILLKSHNYFSFVRGTIWETNHWLFNIQLIVSALFYTSFFKWQLSSVILKKFLKLLTWIFGIGAVLYLIFSGGYFIEFSPFTLIAGSLIVLLSISFYYLELLRSDLILNVSKSLPFYISIGAFIFHLCTTPLFLYGIFFKGSASKEFISVYTVTIFGSNLIMYSIFILGFIICSRARKH